MLEGVGDEVPCGRLLDEVIHRLERQRNNPIFISTTPVDALRRRAEELEALDPEERAALPLYAVPFAVKDNIDVAGVPTTAGCPEYAYVPTQNAFVVDRLLAAGAILVGKCNLDQFATGLTGMRSVYGSPVNPYSPDHVSGGSSSGSAVAVSCGIVQFSLGTDTAGSGRIPAGFNNLVDLHNGDARALGEAGMKMHAATAKLNVAIRVRTKTSHQRIVDRQRLFKHVLFAAKFAQLFALRQRRAHRHPQPARAQSPPL